MVRGVMRIAVDNAARHYSTKASAMGRIARGVGRVATHTITQGRGSFVYTSEGKKILDFACGIGVTNIGHCHPAVVQAVTDQAQTLMHAQVACGYHQPMIDLVEKLGPLMPPGPRGPNDHIFFATTGAEAVENAIKAARMATKKQNVIVFQGGYHGRSYGTMPLTTSKSIYRDGFGPFMGGIHVAPFPYESSYPKSATAVSEQLYSEQALDQFSLILKQQSTKDETCAALIEPVLGEGGYVPAPFGFLRELQQICNDNDILLIADEVQTGFGRTGKLFAVEHSGIKPDILIMAKGLASGMPLSAIAFSKDISDAQTPGQFGGTYSGNIVACASALATIDIIEKENVLENACKQGDRLVAGLKNLQASGKYPIKDVRGLGLMIGVEFDAAITTQLMHESLTQGLLLLNTSVFDCIRFIPPLNVSEKEVDTALIAFENALDSVMTPQ